MAMPFSGLGSGIRRSIKEQPDIELENDIDGEQFKVVIPSLSLFCIFFIENNAYPIDMFY